MRRTRLRLSAIALVLTLSALPAFAGERAALPTKAPNLLAWAWQALERFFPALNEGRGTIAPDREDGMSTIAAPEVGKDGRSTSL